ncbi:MAG: hypothetical protein ACXWNC_02685 [Anaerolineales bacterium]
MDSIAENSKQTEDRPGPILTMLSTVQQTVRRLAGLVILTEEEQIKAGVYFGHEKPQV